MRFRRSDADTSDLAAKRGRCVRERHVVVVGIEQAVICRTKML
jgi:hypothetical protein